MKQFREVRTNLVASDDGFSVEVLGRTGLTYREGNRSMFVDSEVMAGPSGLLVYSSSIGKWDPPFDSELISEAVKVKIISNIRDAFRFQGYDIEVI